MSELHDRLRNLLFLVPYVVRHRGVTLSELTERLGISEEQLLKELAELRAASEKSDFNFQLLIENSPQRIFYKTRRACYRLSRLCRTLSQRRGCRFTGNTCRNQLPLVIV